MTRKDWALLAISHAGKDGLTPAQLQKVLFLLGKGYPTSLRNYYSFAPYNYGPFDKTIYEDANGLAAQGLINLIEKTGSTWSIYTITKEGMAAAEKVDVSNFSNQQKYLEKLVAWAKSLSFEQLISSVYKKYPEYKVNSVFRG